MDSHEAQDIQYIKHPCQNTTILRLKEAINLALEFLPELQSSREAIFATRFLVEQEGYWNNPEFEFEKYSLENIYILSKSIDIYGKRFLRKDIALQDKEVAHSEYSMTRLNIIRNIYITYTNVLLASESLKLAKEEKSLAQQILQTVSQRFKVARESEIQKIKALLSYESSVLVFHQKEQEFYSAKQKLAHLLGKKLLDVSLDYSSFFNLSPPDSLKKYQEKMIHSPFLKKFEYLTQKKKYSLNLERKKFSNPTVKIGVTQKLPFNLHESPQFESGFFSISFPLGICNRNQGNISYSRSKLNQAKYEQSKVRLSLEQQIFEEWQNWKISYQIANKLKSVLLPTAKRAFFVAKMGYEKGKFPYLEVLDVQRTLFDLREKYHRSLRQYHMAKANIELMTTQMNNREWDKI